MSKNRGKLNFVLIGAKSTGKTVYLAKLYTLANITSKNTETIEYLKPFVEVIQKGSFPDATAGGIKELLFNYRDEEFNIEFRIDDYDGKFTEQLHTKDDKEHKDILLNNVRSAEGIFFFFPYEEIINEDKLENIASEVGLFIDTIKEIYSDRKNLPTPVSIAITKWDESPFYKTVNEEERALEYLNSNRTLKKLKDRINLYFENVKIVPISSIDEYNLTEPIKFSIRYTYMMWERRIEELKDDRESLLVYLYDILYDIQYHKNGEYKKLYIELEKELYSKLKTEALSIQGYKNYLFFNKKNKKLLNSLTEEHKNEFASIEKRLLLKNKMKKTVIGASVIAILGIFANNSYNQYLSKTEDILFTDIQKSYQNNNILETLKLIKDYNQEFDKTKNPKHYKEIIEIKNKSITDCRNNLKNRLNSILSLKSIKEQKEKLNLVNGKDSLCSGNNSLDKYIENIDNKYEIYTQLLSNIDSLNIDNISEDNIKNINSLFVEIKNYNEFSQLKKILKLKIANLITDVMSRDNIEVDSLENFYNNIIGLNVSNDLIEKLLSHISQVKLKDEYNDFRGRLNSEDDFSEAVSYVNYNYKNGFKIDEIINILNRIFNKKTKDIIDTMPSFISNYNDFRSLKTRIEEINNLLNSNRIDKISYSPSLDSENSKNYQNKLNLFEKYKNLSVTPSTITFSASSGSNEPLGFKCGGEDEIILYIDRMKYHYDYQKSCYETYIEWGNSDSYTSARYDVKVIEEDIVDNDTFGSSFYLDKDDIITLINGNSITKDLGNGYSIRFGGAN